MSSLQADEPKIIEHSKPSEKSSITPLASNPQTKTALESALRQAKSDTESIEKADTITQPSRSHFTDDKTPYLNPKPIGFTDFLSAFFALIIILGIIFFIAWLGKRSGLVMTGNDKVINIISSASVGYKEKIALIEVGDQQVLIGITSTRIDKLMELEHPVKLSETKPINTKIAQSLSSKNFMQILKNVKKN